jgi:hypothetical protein
MSQELTTTDNRSKIIRFLESSDLMDLRSEETLQPTDTLREIQDLYNLVKRHLAIFILEEATEGKVNLEILKFSKEIRELQNMLFVFKVKLGEMGKDKIPKKTDLIMQLVGELSDTEKLKMGEMLEKKIKLVEETESHGEENKPTGG